MSHVYDWTSLYEGKEYRLSTPILLCAEVVHGFNRGSKELGIPTANLNMVEVGSQGDSLETGIYYGTAKLNNQEYDTVVSIGWNPYYKNNKKTIEAHLLASLSDFYGEKLEISLIGYLRPEANFKSLGKYSSVNWIFSSYFNLDELISCIQSDIKRAQEKLRS